MAINVVETYWTGVLQRIQAEVDIMNQLIVHQGVKGTENEAALGRMIEQLIPKKFGVGSGMLIDSLGNYSKQMDLVVFDRAEEPAILSQTNQVLYPVENVRMCIEVKTTLDKDEIEDGRRKKASVDALHSTTGRLPAFGLLGFRAGIRPSFMAEHLQESLTEHGPRPDLVCVVNAAVIGGGSRAIDLSDGDFNFGVTPLHQQVSLGAREVGVFEAVKNDESSPMVVRYGRAYPTIDTPQGYLVAEPSRALLLFCEGMLRAIQADGVTSVMTPYITALARDTLTLQSV